MIVLRFIAGLALLIAVIALVFDSTRMLPGGGSGIGVTSLGEHWGKLAPSTLKSAQTAVQRYSHPLVWDALIGTVLRLPTWIVFGLVGALFAYAGRRRRRVNIYAN
jgi:hypothetical protein